MGGEDAQVAVITGGDEVNSTPARAAKTRRPRRNPNARYEVYSGYPNPARPGTTSQHECRNFDWAADAWEYAKSLPVDREHTTVNITGWFASTGWQGQHIRQRRNGTWRGLDEQPLTAEQLADRKMGR